MKLGTSQSPGLAEVIREAFGNSLSNLHTSMPGSIVKYYPETQEADVQPLLKLAYVNEDGTEGVDELPVIQGVQVAFPRAGKFFMTFPLAKGDPVLLVFSERSLDEWSASSGKVPVDPVDLRMHDLSDAVAIPGCYPDTKPLQDDVVKGVALGKEKGVHIRITEDETVEITTKGETTSVGGFVALAELVLDELNKIETAYKSHTHQYIPPLHPAVVTPIPTAGPSVAIAALTEPASTNLKAD